MGPRKDVGNYGGYKEQGKEQLKSVQSSQLTTNNTSAFMLKTGRKAEV
jgi:hypothetical protein